MKTSKFFLAVGLTVGLCMPLSAQFTVQSAKILIHSLDGQLIKTYPLSANAGLGYVSVDAGMLSPGIYTYSLSVNNRMVDTKRMVVTE